MVESKMSLCTHLIFSHCYMPNLRAHIYLLLCLSAEKLVLPTNIPLVLEQQNVNIWAERQRSVDTQYCSANTNLRMDYQSLPLRSTATKEQIFGTHKCQVFVKLHLIKDYKQKRTVCFFKEPEERNIFDKEVSIDLEGLAFTVKKLYKHVNPVSGFIAGEPNSVVQGYLVKKQFYGTIRMYDKFRLYHIIFYIEPLSNVALYNAKYAAEEVAHRDGENAVLFEYVSHAQDSKWLHCNTALHARNDSTTETTEVYLNNGSTISDATSPPTITTGSATLAAATTVFRTTVNSTGTMASMESTTPYHSTDPSDLETTAPPVPHSTEPFTAASPELAHSTEPTMAPTVVHSTEPASTIEMGTVPHSTDAGNLTMPHSTEPTTLHETGSPVHSTTQVDLQHSTWVTTPPTPTLGFENHSTEAVNPVFTLGNHSTETWTEPTYSTLHSTLFTTSVPINHSTVPASPPYHSTEITPTTQVPHSTNFNDETSSSSSTPVVTTSSPESTTTTAPSTLGQGEPRPGEGLTVFGANCGRFDFKVEKRNSSILFLKANKPDDSLKELKNQYVLTEPVNGGEVVLFVLELLDELVNNIREMRLVMRSVPFDVVLEIRPVRCSEIQFTRIDNKAVVIQGHVKENFDQEILVINSNKKKVDQTLVNFCVVYDDETYVVQNVTGDLVTVIFRECNFTKFVASTEGATTGSQYYHSTESSKLAAAVGETVTIVFPGTTPSQNGTVVSQDTVKVTVNMKAALDHALNGTKVSIENSAGKVIGEGHIVSIDGTKVIIEFLDDQANFGPPHSTAIYQLLHSTEIYEDSTPPTTGPTASTYSSTPEVVHSTTILASPVHSTMEITPSFATPASSAPAAVTAATSSTSYSPAPAVHSTQGYPSPIHSTSVATQANQVGSSGKTSKLATTQSAQSGSKGTYPHSTEPYAEAVHSTYATFKATMGVSNASTKLKATSSKESRTTALTAPLASTGKGKTGKPEHSTEPAIQPVHSTQVAPVTFDHGSKPGATLEITGPGCESIGGKVLDRNETFFNITVNPPNAKAVKLIGQNKIVSDAHGNEIYMKIVAATSKEIIAENIPLGSEAYKAAYPFVCSWVQFTPPDSDDTKLEGTVIKHEGDKVTIDPGKTGKKDVKPGDIIVDDYDNPYVVETINKDGTVVIKKVPPTTKPPTAIAPVTTAPAKAASTTAPATIAPATTIAITTRRTTVVSSGSSPTEDSTPYHSSDPDETTPMATGIQIPHSTEPPAESFYQIPFVPSTEMVLPFHSTDFATFKSTSVFSTEVFTGISPPATASRLTVSGKTTLGGTTVGATGGTTVKAAPGNATMRFIPSTEPVTYIFSTEVTVEGESSVATPAAIPETGKKSKATTLAPASTPAQKLKATKKPTPSAALIAFNASTEVTTTTTTGATTMSPFIGSTEVFSKITKAPTTTTPAGLHSTEHNVVPHSTEVAARVTTESTAKMPEQSGANQSGRRRKRGALFNFNQFFGENAIETELEEDVGERLDFAGGFSSSDIFDTRMEKASICQLCIWIQPHFAESFGFGAGLLHGIAEVVDIIKFTDWIFRAIDFNQDGIAENIGFSIKRILLKDSVKFNGVKRRKREDSNLGAGSPENLLVRKKRQGLFEDYYENVYDEEDKNGTRAGGGNETTLEDLLNSFSREPQSIDPKTALLKGANGLGTEFADCCAVLGFMYHDMVPAISAATERGLCTPKNLGLVSGFLHAHKLTKFDVFRGVMHALGHLFGAPHDAIFDEECQDYQLYNFINPFPLHPIQQTNVGARPNSFRYSPCAKDEITSFLSSNGPSCLREESIEYCGNGIQDEGEDCDCGSPWQCHLTYPCCGEKDVYMGCKIINPTKKSCHRPTIW